MQSTASNSPAAARKKTVSGASGPEAISSRSDRPRTDVVKAIQARIDVRRQRRAEFAKLRDTPAFTRDGAKITLWDNIMDLFRRKKPPEK